MTGLRVAFFALAAGASLAPAALAADLGGQRRPPPPIAYEASPFSWSGFYIGTHLGYGWSDVNWQETPAFNGSHSGTGALAGGQVGYNWQSGRVVYGIEGDLSSSWIDGGNGCCGHTINWLGSVRGRLGLAVGSDNRTLLYATAGAAWADIDYSSVGSYSDTHFGWVAGAGIERALTPNLSAKIEYLYYGFDTVTAPPGTVAPGAGTANLDPSAQTIRFGLNIRY